MVEKMVFVLPEEGIIRALCEVEDIQDDPEIKVFRFREWPRHEDGLAWSGMRGDNSAPHGAVRSIVVFSFWKDEFEIGEIEARYRITARLETPSGYVAAYEGTTKPALVALPVPDGEGYAERARLTSIEDTIISALEKGGRMVLSALRRKTHAYRFGDDWEKCLQNLAEQGELEIEPDDAGRKWIRTTNSTT